MKRTKTVQVVVLSLLFVLIAVFSGNANARRDGGGSAGQEL